MRALLILTALLLSSCASLGERTRAVGDVFRDCRACPEMVVLAGAPLEQSGDASVGGSNLAVGRFEVTFAQWDACVAGGGCNGYRPEDNGWGRGAQPVVNVSRADAQAYTRWLSQRTGQPYRLLTSSEWERTARAGTTADYAWGNEGPVCDRNARNGANFNVCENGRTFAVGSFQPSEQGLYDLHGNAGEWVEDCYEATCYFGVVRGGSWTSNTALVLSVNRDWVQPLARSYDIGFRVAMSVRSAPTPASAP